MGRETRSASFSGAIARCVLINRRPESPARPAPERPGPEDPLRAATSAAAAKAMRLPCVAQGRSVPTDSAAPRVIRLEAEVRRCFDLLVARRSVC